MEHSLILAVGVWFLQRFDVTKKLLHERLNGLALGRLRLGFETGEPELAAFQFVALVSLSFLDLGDGGASAFSPPSAVFVPFHVVVPLGQRSPVITAGALTRDRAEAPPASYLHLLEDVNAGTSLSLKLISRIDKKADIMAVTY
jgi:hypothetical protein